jgi:aminomethyltransferase
LAADKKFGRIINKTESIATKTSTNSSVFQGLGVYATKDTALRTCAGRFFVHDNGDDMVAAYWALRKQAVLYDVPERPVEISGPDALVFLEKIFVRQISSLMFGRGYYTLACTHSGGLFMDGILFRLGETRFWFVQPDGDMHTWFLAHNTGFDVTISDPKSRALQLQGPMSFIIMNAASAGLSTVRWGISTQGFST